VHIDVALALGFFGQGPTSIAPVRLVLICVGKVRPPFTDDVAHYERLLGRQARLEVVELAEAGADPARSQEALAREADAIVKRIPKGAYVCVLDREGEEITSEDLAAFVEQRRMARADLCFIVGGPLGVDPAITTHSQRRIAFGRVTLPHQLARVVLMEQLFRAHKILAGEPYHY
jgi:23S rRNA (pseudouridine1915-N3)-methyltransferase